MINRNEVAREKMQRAAEMLQDNNIDMWVFYARLKTDTALELMFNTDSKNEVMFLLTKSGDRIAIATAADTKAYEESGLYTEVIEVSGDGFEKVFKEKFDQYQVKRLAVNDSTIDTRCDGLTVGLFKKTGKSDRCRNNGESEMLQLLYAGGVKSGKDTERNRDYERMQPYYNRYLRCTF